MELQTQLKSQDRITCLARCRWLQTGGQKLKRTDQLVGRRDTPTTNDERPTTSMFERLDQIEARYEELTQALASPEIVTDSARYQKTAKAHSEIAPIVEKYREYKDLKRGIAESKARARRRERSRHARLRAGRTHQARSARRPGRSRLKVLLLPKDPNDEKDVILEIRAGTGGDEATLFAAEMFRMYSRFAETQGWKVEVLSTSESSVGGLKEVIAIIEGKRVFSQLKYESGVHRVQRVPATETAGPRAHFGRDGRRAARSRRRRHQDRSQRPAHRHLLLVGPRRPVGEHDLFRRAHHAHSHQHRGQLPGREIADQEPRERHARAAPAPLRNRNAETAGRAGERAQSHGRLRRPRRAGRDRGGAGAGRPTRRRRRGPSPC